jgi:hypothetical protein
LAASTITAFICPRSMRSRRSASESSIVAGLSTAPSFIAASISSHSSTRLGSITSRRSPRPIPRLRRKLAARSEATRSSSKLRADSAPDSSTTHSARRALPRARSSKWSSAQLNVGSDGQRNSAMALA